MLEANKQTVRTFIAAMSEGNPDAMEACLAPDAVAITRGFSNFTGSADRETIIRLTGALKTLMPEGLKLEVLRLVAEGNEVVAEFVGDATTIAGPTYANEYCMLFTLQDGRIARTHEYFCTRLAQDVLWPIIVEGGFAADAGGG